MKSKFFRTIVLCLIVLVVIYWLPFLLVMFITNSDIKREISDLPESDAVIIFGTVVNDKGDVSPLLKERLEAGKAVYESGKAKKIVVSNTEAAAKVMAVYLISKGIYSDFIEQDIQAEKTSDTCEYEKATFPKNRKLIFVSQGFHLPRLLYQCDFLGVEGTAYPAENLPTIDRSKYSFLTKARVRAIRYFREAGLIWLAFLNHIK